MSLRRLAYRSPFLWLILSGAGTLALAFTQPHSRIRGPIENGQTFVLPHSVHPRASVDRDRGEVDPALVLPRITLHFSMTAAQRKDLDLLLTRQQDRSSGEYHKWLTPQQFAERFGLNDQDIAKVTAWLQNSGFTNVEVAHSRRWVRVSATAGQAASAFQTSIHRYDVDGGHYANASDVSLPRALEGVVKTIRGLDDFRPHPRAWTIHPQYNFSGDEHGIAPADLATIYNIRPVVSAGVDGKGQTIVIPGESDIDLADIRAFRTAADLPANDPQVILKGEDPGTKDGPLYEANLDIEWAGAVAPGAKIVYVNEKNAFEGMIDAIDENLGTIITFSYGGCEGELDQKSAEAISSIVDQANTQGITIVNASGDLGAAACDYPKDGAPWPVSAAHGYSVGVPADMPGVTAVGGTQFGNPADQESTYWELYSGANHGSAKSYIPERAWNQGGDGFEIVASGGGKSKFFPKPAWQAGDSVPADGARDVPDVALSASWVHDPYVLCAQGSCVTGFADANNKIRVAGGTSVSAPVFAGIVALLNQQMGSAQGNINPRLYQLASTSKDAFHDVTAGDNKVSCLLNTPDCTRDNFLQIGYSAAPGYDLVTGLGSVDAYALINEWSSWFQVAASPGTLTLGRGTTGTVGVQVTSTGNFKGNVTFACTVSAGLTNTTCSVPGSVTGSGNASLTITNSSQASAWWPHVNSTAGFAVAALCLAGLLSLQRRRRLILPGFAMLGMAALVSCGGGSDSQSYVPPPALNGIVTVTATSGIVTQTASINVTVP